ncbi:MAG: HD domain-containing protein [Proteobacteria bacterium]|nr:HD domain-containing protein [Pseudomonadota bacterium]
MNEVRKVLEDRFPGLYANIEKLLVEAEAQYNTQTGQAPSEFLLEHTQRTAAIAHKISVLEGVDAFLPVLVALFHDAGKFHEGEYHKDGIPEEEHAALLAGQMLTEFQVERGDIDSVLEALRALYDERLPCLGPCRIVQDADRLDKLGPLGVSAFFLKAALRGRGLIDALVQTLSRELTYAVAAPRSMFTATGRRLAGEQAPKTIAFFDQLLDQLESWGIASFDRHTIVLDEDFRTRDGAIACGLEVTIAMPRACPDCGGPLTLTHMREQGLKCERFIARFKCGGCGYASGTSLCLPVLA